MGSRAIFAALLTAVLVCGQQARATIEVTGAVPQPLSLTAEDLAKMPRASSGTKGSDTDTFYEGVPLHEILKKAGVPLGSALRGKALASYVLASAQDGYQVVFSVAELDPSFTGIQVLLADTANGKPLTGTSGRFRLVIASDKVGARSVRMLTRLEVVQLRK